MNSLLWLIPIAIVLGLIGLAGFFWTIRNDQYEDPEGDAARILHSEDKPL
ncbi:MAG: cbb3-type cytochrome oxidase assembly protein CcoS [Acidimicrobiales bacterium]|nr:cbb3-type cytochrome oxidase assembly protein CcoS [Hyphomonadaceae bacterium]RZV43954.1 MAG: cbb3-type cytochrome oxidase assembly protein CcoS [Acidimicrobiales bacterium]